MSKTLIIGKITGAHGIRGEVKVFPITDNVRRFSTKKLKNCYITDENGNNVVPKLVATSRNDNGTILLRFEDVIDRTAAETLRGKYIAVDREDAVKLPKGSYFIVDLIGLEVIDDERGSLGKVTDCLETGANFVFDIKRKGKQDLLIPYLNSICYEVNIEAGHILVRLPEGLYELYE